MLFPKHAYTLLIKPLYAPLNPKKIKKYYTFINYAYFCGLFAKSK
jgi:hypothetical protein